MTVTDNVLFIFPKDLAMGYACAAAMQEWVNHYVERMKAYDVMPVKSEYSLNYVYQMPVELGNVLRSVEYYLTQAPCEFQTEHLTAVFDFSDERLKLFHGNRKHITQVLGAFIGTTVPVFPSVRQVKARADKAEWVWLQDIDNDTAQKVAQVQDNEVTGIIGPQGLATFVAASMGLPVIELVDTELGKTWLSKWSNRYYRMVEVPGNVEEQIKQAQTDIWALLQEHKETQGEPLAMSLKEGVLIDI